MSNIIMINKKKKNKKKKVHITYSSSERLSQKIDDIAFGTNFRNNKKFFINYPRNSEANLKADKGGNNSLIFNSNGKTPYCNKAILYPYKCCYPPDFCSGKIISPISVKPIFPIDPILPVKNERRIYIIPSDSDGSNIFYFTIKIIVYKVDKVLIETNEKIEQITSEKFKVGTKWTFDKDSPSKKNGILNNFKNNFYWNYPNLSNNPRLFKQSPASFIMLLDSSSSNGQLFLITKNNNSDSYWLTLDTKNTYDKD